MRALPFSLSVSLGHHLGSGLFALSETKLKGLLACSQFPYLALTPLQFYASPSRGSESRLSSGNNTKTTATTREASLYRHDV